MQDIRRKLSQKRGESITEVLVAVVVSALAILMLAMAIASASSSVRSSIDVMAGRYEASNKLALHESNIDPSPEGTVKLVLKGESGAEGHELTLDNDVIIYTTAEDSTAVSYRNEAS